MLKIILALYFLAGLTLAIGTLKGEAITKAFVDGLKELALFLFLVVIGPVLYLIVIVNDGISWVKDLIKEF